MTSEQLDEIEKLAEAATPGPWVWYGPSSDAPADLWTADGKDAIVCVQTTNADIKFIRAMREYTLPLVKALREARAAATRQTEKLVQSEELTDHLHKERDEARALLAALKEEYRPADELRSQLLAEIEAHAETRFKIARVTDWYQQRFNALRAWVGHDVAPLSVAVAQKYWNIVANGSPSPHESADWAGTMHAANLRADIAEGKMREAQKERDEARAERDTFKAECASISEEFGLPPTIRPAEGEIRRMLDGWQESRAEVERLKALLENKP